MGDSVPVHLRSSWYEDTRSASEGQSAMDSVTKDDKSAPKSFILEMAACEERSGHTMKTEAHKVKDNKTQAAERKEETGRESRSRKVNTEITEVWSGGMKAGEKQHTHTLASQLFSNLFRSSIRIAGRKQTQTEPATRMAPSAR